VVSDDGTNPCDSGFPDIPVANVTEHCPWFYDALHEWKARG
jgi:hypothetical protein